MKSPETKQRKLSPLRLSVSNNQVLNFIILGLTGFLVFFFLHFSYIFIFACTESLLISAGFLQLRGGSQSSLWYMGFSLQWLFFLWSIGSRQIGSVVVAWGSRAQTPIVVVPGVSCSTATNWTRDLPGIFPDQRSNLCPLHWQAVFYPLYHQEVLY